MSKATKEPKETPTFVDVVVESLKIELDHESHDAKVSRLMSSLSAKQKEQAETDSDYKTELRRLQGDIDGIRSELKRTQEGERNRRIEATRAKIKNCQTLDSSEDAA